MAEGEQNGEAKPYSQVAAEHIRQLSEANKLVPKLLHESGTAISLLTTRPVTTSTSTSTTSQSFPPLTTASRKQLIQDSTYTLYTTLTTLRTLLHTEIASLQSHHIIPARESKIFHYSSKPQREGGDEESRRAEEEERMRDPEGDVVNGGMGDLDMATLNARSGKGRAGGNGIDEEVWGRAGELLERSAKTKE